MRSLLSGSGPAALRRGGTRGPRGGAAASGPGELPEHLADDVDVGDQRGVGGDEPQAWRALPVHRLDALDDEPGGGRVSPCFATLRRDAEATGTRLTVGQERAEG